MSSLNLDTPRASLATHCSRAENKFTLITQRIAAIRRYDNLYLDSYLDHTSEQEVLEQRQANQCKSVVLSSDFYTVVVSGVVVHKLCM